MAQTAADVTPSPLAPRAELRQARDAVFREYLRRHGRVPSRALVDTLLCSSWYRLSDQALDLLHRSTRRRGRPAR